MEYKYTSIRRNPTGKNQIKTYIISLYTGNKIEIKNEECVKQTTTDKSSQTFQTWPLTMRKIHDVK